MLGKKGGERVLQPYIEHFLADVWAKLAAIYKRESERINALNDQSRLQAGIFNYLKVTWHKEQGAYGMILLDIYEPLDWSDSAYKIEADAYIEEFTETFHIEELFDALCVKMEQVFQSSQYGTRFFDYYCQVVLEFEHNGKIIHYQKELLNQQKLALTKQELATFIETKIMAEPPARPSDNDEFFFAQHLVNPHFFQQRAEEIEPLISRLQDKHRANPQRLERWNYYYTRALEQWAEAHFLTHYFEQTEAYTKEWMLTTAITPQQIAQEKLDFLLYSALKIGQQEPATCQKYLELAKQLGSEKATMYLQAGSGRYESRRQSNVLRGQANDILQTITIHIIVEEEKAYQEALHYIMELLQAGFPKGYKLLLKSKVKHYLPVKGLAKSKLHQFFANCFTYPSLFPLLANYAQMAMEAYAWYQDVEPSKKSAMPGTYAVFGLGLYSDAYFPLVQSYMALVDTEHQSVQNAYADAFLKAHGLAAELMPVFIAILLAANESAKPLKGLNVCKQDCIRALVVELAKKEDYERAFALYRIFGRANNLAQRLKQEAPPIKEELEQLLQWMDT